MTKISKLKKDKEFRSYMTIIVISWSIIFAAVTLILFVGDLPIYKNHSEQMYHKALDRSCVEFRKTKPSFDCKKQLSLRSIKRSKTHSGEVLYHYYFTSWRDKTSHQVVVSASGDINENLAKEPTKDEAI